jgi:hypothetical protein
MVFRKSWLGFSFARRRPVLGCLTAAAYLLAIGGCGKSQDPVGRPPVFHAEGKLVYDNGPLAGAFVVLHPRAPSGPSSPRPHGQAAADGSFTLTSYDSNDGAPAGEYAVTVELRPLVKNGGDYAAGPNVLPKKYSRAETSPVTVKIAEGNNDLAPIQIAR